MCRLEDKKQIFGFCSIARELVYVKCGEDRRKKYADAERNASPDVVTLHLGIRSPTNANGKDFNMLERK